jgi:hypothetical protein
VNGEIQRVIEKRIGREGNRMEENKKGKEKKRKRKEKEVVP